ncbi:MAG: hypothetical protein ABJF11_01885 [Reichenbachiella sp.]|uniref:hypothetical protein n=1 Tax=Reichenbachiella sp. TaxID=2184521 RepID=UPI003265B853
MKILLIIIGILFASSTYAHPAKCHQRTHARVVVVKKARPAHRKVWIEGHWVKTRKGKVWVAGRWKRI